MFLILFLNCSRIYMVKLDVLKFYLALLILRLELFLVCVIFGDFQPRCSYKNVLINKECTKTFLNFIRAWSVQWYFPLKFGIFDFFERFFGHFQKYLERVKSFLNFGNFGNFHVKFNESLAFFLS